MSIWSAITKRATYEESLTQRRGLKSKGRGKGPRWTAAEDAYLKKWYGKKPTSEIARKLRRTVPAVGTHAQLIGLKMGKNKSWTPEEDAFLRTWYREKPIEWIIAHIGRTPSTIKTRANKLGIHKQVLGRSHTKHRFALRPDEQLYR